jgi:hypothetical protein
MRLRKVATLTVGALILLAGCAHSGLRESGASGVSSDSVTQESLALQERLTALEAEIALLRSVLTESLPASLELHKDARQRIDFIYQTLGGVK